MGLTSVLGASRQKPPSHQLPCMLICTFALTSNTELIQGESVGFTADPRRPGEQPGQSVSHYLLPVHQTNCSQRRIPAFALKSVPEYSKLLALLQNSSRPSRHPQAVQLWVPPYLSFQLLGISHWGRQPLLVHHPTFWEAVDVVEFM